MPITSACSVSSARVAHAAGHRAAADSDEYNVEPRIVSDGFEADRAGAFAGGQVQAVLDQVGAVCLRDLLRQQAGVFDVLAFEPDSAPKAAIWRSLSGLAVLAATTVTSKPRREPL